MVDTMTQNDIPEDHLDAIVAFLSSSDIKAFLTDDKSNTKTTVDNHAIIFNDKYEIDDSLAEGITSKVYLG